jgi:ribosomal protein S27AE
MTEPNLTRQADWRRRHPSKYAAHLAVQRALKHGELIKTPCEVCGEAKVDAHHDDYKSPLAVRWLCRRHHVRLHKRGQP